MTTKPKPLDPRTLRWAARKAATYERELRQFRDEAQDFRKADIYDRAAATAFVLKSTFLSQARRVEGKGRKK
ncbi:MAG TPA: hypothetical protein VL494_13370 [Steroidobacteraceae bacterium]|jgi:hypothetical protein|nr:hypothetical protein [Steroidobacteraceae bacterium]